MPIKVIKYCTYLETWRVERERKDGVYRLHRYPKNTTNASKK